jgi:hypothetical protein
MPVQIARMKPQGSEALQYTGYNLEEVRDFVPAHLIQVDMSQVDMSREPMVGTHDRMQGISIAVGKEYHMLRPHDWILNHGPGGFQCLNPRDFKHIYDTLDGQPIQ